MVETGYNIGNVDNKDEFLAFWQDYGFTIEKNNLVRSIGEIGDARHILSRTKAIIKDLDIYYMRLERSIKGWSTRYKNLKRFKKAKEYNELFNRIKRQRETIIARYIDDLEAFNPKGSTWTQQELINLSKNLPSLLEQIERSLTGIQGSITRFTPERINWIERILRLRINILRQLEKTTTLVTGRIEKIPIVKLNFETYVRGFYPSKAKPKRIISIEATKKLQLGISAPAGVDENTFWTEIYNRLRTRVEDEFYKNLSDFEEFSERDLDYFTWELDTSQGDFPRDSGELGKRKK